VTIQCDNGFIYGESGDHWFFCDEIWTVGLQPVLCTVHCMIWRAVLLEDEPSGQPVIA